jgi:hypothetical protein
MLMGEKFAWPECGIKCYAKTLESYNLSFTALIRTCVLFRGWRVRSSACIQYLQAIFTCIVTRPLFVHCFNLHKKLFKGTISREFFLDS